MDAPPASPLPAPSALPWQRAAAGAGLLAGSVPQPTIFARMSARAAQLGAMNLGQGFPDTDPPAAVADAAVRAIREGVNQYPPGPGAPALRAAIAEHQRRFYGLDVDPATEVLVTTGATEALASAILGLVRPGDEVLTLAPWYDAYGALIALAGGIHRTVAIRELGEEGGDGRARGVRLGVDLEELRCAFTDRTLPGVGIVRLRITLRRAAHSGERSSWRRCSLRAPPRGIPAGTRVLNDQLRDCRLPRDGGR